MSAQQQSELAFARVLGMKIAARVSPPTAATGGFPYPARSCAEWSDDELDKRFKPGRARVKEKLPREMSSAQRTKDAVRGSAALRDAILAIAA